MIEHSALFAKLYCNLMYNEVDTLKLHIFAFNIPIPVRKEKVFKVHSGARILELNMLSAE